MAKLTYTGAEVQSLLDKVNGISGGGGGIAYPLSWSGYSSGVYDGSAPANIEIPSLVSQLTNDSDYITTASVNSLLTDYLSKSGGTVDGKIFYGGGRISGDVKLTSMVVDDNANSGKIIFAGANYDYGDNDYKMGPYIQGINLAGWGKKKISFFQRDYSVEGYNADPVEVFSVMPDGEIQLNGTIHFTKEVPMIKMVENGWAQSKVMWHSWDSTEGDSLWLQIPSGVENNAYFKLCRLAPSILNTPLQVNGNITATGSFNNFNTPLNTPANELSEGINILRGTYADAGFANGDVSFWWTALDIGFANKSGVSGDAGYRSQILVPNTKYYNRLFLRRGGDTNWFSTREFAFVDTDSLTPSSGLLTVNGNFLATGEVSWNSSRVLKDIIGDTPTYMSLDDLMLIKPYRYTWKDARDLKIHAGGIADEVMEILPEVVMTDANGIHSMDYGQAAFTMAASLTPYVNDHERRIKELERENRELKKRLNVE